MTRWHSLGMKSSLVFAVVVMNTTVKHYGHSSLRWHRTRLCVSPCPRPLASVNELHGRTGHRFSRGSFYEEEHIHLGRQLGEFYHSELQNEHNMSPRQVVKVKVESGRESWFYSTTLGCQT